MLRDLENRHFASTPLCASHPPDWGNGGDCLCESPQKPAVCANYTSTLGGVGQVIL
jgi:hypothetical protein